MRLQLHNTYRREKNCPSPQDGGWAIFLTPVFLGFSLSFCFFNLVLAQP